MSFDMPGRRLRRKSTHNFSVRLGAVELFELLLIVFYVSLYYKLNLVGIAALAGIGAIGLRFPIKTGHLTGPISLLTIAYLFLSTATAVYYDFGAGAYRFTQFVLIVVAAFAFSNYAANYAASRGRKLFNKFFMVTVAVFVHMVLFHLATGHIVTWKYLADTKTTLTILPVLLFAYEDTIKARNGLWAWAAALLVLTACIFLSGERKAYMLLALLFAVSRTSPVVKAGALVAVLLALGFYVSQAGDDDYLKGQLVGIFAEDRDMHISEFYLIESIGDQSNIIRDFVSRMSAEQFAAHPWFGLGAGGYLNWSTNTFGTLLESGGLSMNVHGEVNRIPVENGYLGIVISLSLLVLVGLAVFRQLIVTGGWASSSWDRLAAYFFVALLTYTWYEALDTFMLSMIALCCLEAARIDAAVRQPKRFHQVAPSVMRH